LLRGLKKYSRDITAVVAVSDTGKSSGVIRKVFKTLPPGDIRKCLAALSSDYRLLSEVFEYRFPKGSGFLSGHSLGNIWIAALTEKFGSFEKAIEVSHHLLDTVGKVYPSTLENVQITAVFDNGKRVFGEDRIPLVGKRIKRIYLSKSNVKAYKKSIDAIKNANLIIIGPGSLYTSVMPNILVPKIRDTIIQNKHAVRIFIANCSTEKGETEGYSIEDHIEAIEKHTRERIFDYVLVNSQIVKKSKKADILGEINNITCNLDNYKSYQIIHRNLVDRRNPLFHDQKKLAKEIILHYNRVRES